MSTQEEKQAILNLLTEYDNALNSANIALIPSFYAEDGMFMPDGMQELSRSDLQKKNHESYLKKVQFRIDFTIADIIIDGRYAFVQAIAKANSRNLETDKVSAKTSRDLFILRKDQDKWKIFRYIFNNVKEQQN